MAFIPYFDNLHWNLSVGTWVPNGSTPSYIEQVYDAPYAATMTQVVGLTFPNAATVRITYANATVGDTYWLSRIGNSGGSWLLEGTGTLPAASGTLEFTVSNLVSDSGGTVGLRIESDAGMQITNIEIQENAAPTTTTTTTTMAPHRVGTLGSSLMLAVDAAHSSPCAVGVSGGVGVPVEVGVNALSAAAAIPHSVDGPVRVGAVGQPMPMTLRSGVGSLASPLALANPQFLAAPYDVSILLDGRDITRIAGECRISSSESTLFDTVTMTLPDGSAWPLSEPPQVLVVMFSDAVHTFMVEEFTGNGAARSIWGRPPSASFAEPWSASGVWNDRAHGVATAAALAGLVAQTTFTAHNFPLPRIWEVDGTPAEVVQKLAAAAGGIAVALSDQAGIVVRRRWPVRPVDMSSASVIINRETALELDITRNDSPRYGEVTVRGWAPDALLPQFVVEGSPVLGRAAYVRLYWPGPNVPRASDWITNGHAYRLGRHMETLTETVVFADGAASVAYPIWDLVDSEWVGTDYGEILWLENGYGTGLELSAPGHGVARVTYRTQYERWCLTNQAVDTVLFGVDVVEGTVAARVLFSSGGANAGEVTEPLLGDVASCVVHGTALLDDSRVRHNVRATLPRLGHVATGSVARVEDDLTGVAGFGKVTGVETVITPSRITQQLEVALC